MAPRHLIWISIASMAWGGCGDDAAPAVAVDTREGPDLAADVAPSIDTDPADAGPSPTDATPDATPADTLGDAMADTTLADTLSDAVADTALADTAGDTQSDTNAGAPDTPPLESRPDPALTGPWAVNTSSIELAGFTVDLYRPVTEGDVPGLILSPGFQLDGALYAWLARHLASHGLVVMVPTFGDGIFGALDHSALADAVIAMLADLDGTPGVDGTRLGLAGHSRGGKVSILAATRDIRIQAVLGLDPVDAVPPGQAASTDNPSVTPELMGLVKVPLGLIGSEYGGTSALPGVAPVCAPVEDNYAAYAAHATAASALHTWVIPESGHNDFADPLSFTLSLACPAGDDPTATRARAAALATAFFKRYLAGDLRYAADL